MEVDPGAQKKGFEYYITVGDDGNVIAKADPHIIINDGGPLGDGGDGQADLGGPDFDKMQKAAAAAFTAAVAAVRPLASEGQEDKGIPRFFFPFGIQSISVTVQAAVALQVQIQVSGTVPTS